MVGTRSKTSPGPRSRPRPNLSAHPSESELITSFLRPRVVSGGNRPPTCSASFIHDADVYSAGPAALTGGHAPAVASSGGGDSAWYFFSAVRAKTRDGQRKARTVDTGEGCWHSEAGARPVVEDGAGRVLVGHRQGFSFVTKVDGRRVRSGWLMVELSLDGADSAGDVVLCKIYFSPRARASASACKRKADDDDEKNPANSASQRHRGPATTEVEAGTSAPNNAEERGDTQSRRGLADDDNSTVTDEDDALWTDDSTFSWWIRNKDWLMEEFGIVDRADEEIQKAYKIDEYLRLLKHRYTDFGRGHSPVLNS